MTENASQTLSPAACFTLQPSVCSDPIKAINAARVYVQCVYASMSGGMHPVVAALDADGAKVMHTNATWQYTRTSDSQ